MESLNSARTSSDVLNTSTTRKEALGITTEVSDFNLLPEVDKALWLPSLRAALVETKRYFCSRCQDIALEKCQHSSGFGWSVIIQKAAYGLMCSSDLDCGLCRILASCLWTRATPARHGEFSIKIKCSLPL